ncbi:MAG: hypothetical protein M1828_001428 [Chrysothrix sp. TS-e1954]|nr:MAG: hypothetical protein M1828_001428 [Chrysothrix sp. TS-e1954]
MAKFGSLQEPNKIHNKMKRSTEYLKRKKANENSKRDSRFRRKRDEDKTPRLRTERRARNIPATIDAKRVWDEEDIGDETGIGVAVDVERRKRRKMNEQPKGDDTTALSTSNVEQLEAQDAATGTEVSKGGSEEAFSSEEDDLASILGDDDELPASASEEHQDGKDASMGPPPVPVRSSGPTNSTTSSTLSLIPDALASKFPTLFKPPEAPKILITTSLGGTVHREAELLTELFPNSDYVLRQRHRYKSHHYSLREISKYAANRGYTSLLVLEEDLKRPSGLTVIHLPIGPTFHFKMSNWVEGKKLAGHGRPTEHYPELILNNFRTPLGLLAAHLFRTMFPPQPEVEGRQVVTLHNQRDYIFVRRHRYIFRDKRSTEKSISGTDGKLVKGVEEIKAGLQELGPRFTLKLRRVDKGIQRASGQEWEWKAGMEKQRTKFQL